MRRFQFAYPAIAGLLFFSGCQGEQSMPQKQADRSISIVPHQVNYATETTRIEAVGTARARSSATLQPETAGEVTSVNFTAGDKVSKGDILVRLESRAERLAVQQAEITQPDAERLIDRYNRVSTPGVIAGNERDRAQAAHDASEVQIDIAKDALANRLVRAPFSGHVGLTDIDPGARVTTSTIITRLDDREVLFVDFPVPEQTFGKITGGDTFQVEPFSDPDARYTARVLTVDSTIDATTRAYTVRTSIENGEDRLRPGMSFRIGFNLQGRAYPAVPEASIAWGGDGAYVWAVTDGKAARVPVTIVSREKGRVLVKADIAEGSWIIEEGVQKVRQGAPVETAGKAMVPARPAPPGQASPGIPSSAER